MAYPAIARSDSPMFSKFSIRTKIVSLVCLLLVALAAQGALSAMSMRSLNADTGRSPPTGCRVSGRSAN